MTTWKAEGSGRAARAGRGPGRGAWGTLAAGCAVQGVREVVGARRARIPEPTLAGGGGGESSERLSGGARHHPPPPHPATQACKSEPSGAETGKGRARAAAPKPLTLPCTPPSRPHLELLSFLPFPRPEPTPLRASIPVPRRGRDRETPALSPDAPGMLRAPRSCLPGAAAPGAGAARLLLASAPSFSASPRTLSWAPSSETGPGCSRLPRRRLGRRCCRQRTPSGGWKPV